MLKRVQSLSPSKDSGSEENDKDRADECVEGDQGLGTAETFFRFICKKTVFKSNSFASDWPVANSAIFPPLTISCYNLSRRQIDLLG